ncbi:MAG: type I-E CRISPR-associated endoribonuclease Cas2e [Chloroflexota bacterium]|nr:type I-E CRISPR-associated endoribonuclease Cas2e [Chloroflexota bacterium]
MLEPSTGVFLGNPSARVRDELWAKAVKALRGRGAVMQVWSSNNPQGFSYRQSGPTDRVLVDFEGLSLVSRTPSGSRPPQDDDTGST